MFDSKIVSTTWYRPQLTTNLLVAFCFFLFTQSKIGLRQDRTKSAGIRQEGRPRKNSGLRAFMRWRKEGAANAVLLAF